MFFKYRDLPHGIIGECCVVNTFYLSKNMDISIILEGVIKITQEELRTLYNERLIREKQTYISKITGIDGSILSKFRLGKINLYPHLFARLEKYLTTNH